MPYWRLSSFYFFYFAALGALMPYWGLFLQSKGFDALAIGSLMALLMATKIVAPNLWGWLGDHIGQRMLIVRLAAGASFLIFMGMFGTDTFVAVALIMVLFSFFWNASLPQFEVVTFSYLKGRVARYAHIRLWGSVGFIITVVLVGMLVDIQGPAVILPSVLAMFFGILLASFSLSDPSSSTQAESERSLYSVLKKPAILAFFVAVFLMQMAHGPYYAFYSIYLSDYDYSKTVIGLLWGLGVLAEVVLFLGMHRLLERWGGRTLLLVSLLLAALRWLLIGLFPELPVLVFAQLLHAATFGSFHAAAIHLVHHYFRGRHKGRGQALYSSLSFGAGGAVGAFGSGISWQHWGPGLTFVIAAGVSLLGAYIVWRYIDAAHDY